ncbi:hypothetical protein ACFC1R_07595 [Kitasatospora sp. NPDC056138]|uniref:hypothetical protein n=1 Tax=Kitasatospora sp. NPDC056138 TaxID=3345724 RepID=UPI0035D604C2
MAGRTRFEEQRTDGAPPSPRRPRQRMPAGRAARTTPAEHEAALVGGYTELTRLAYLVLAGTGNRHRRVLAAHGIVQRSLPHRPLTAVVAAAAAPAADPAERTYQTIRLRVLRRSLATARHRLPLPLPLVWGLRLFPAAGSPEDVALHQALARLPPAARAGCLLRLLDGLTDAQAAEWLGRLGVREPIAVVRAGDLLLTAYPDAAERLTGSPEFDPCAVRAQPTDLLRRRTRTHVAAAGAATALLALTGLVATGTVTLAPTRNGGPVAVPGPGSGTVRAMAVLDTGARIVPLVPEIQPASAR